MSKLDDLFAELVAHTKYNSKALAGIYMALQQKEAEKVADEWRPYYAVVNSPVTQQIVRGEFRRGSIAIYNAGPSAVLLGTSYFDGPSMVTAYNQANPGSVLPIFPVASGGNTSIPAKGPIFAYSVNTGGASPNAVLSMVETLFDILGGHPRKSPLRPGEMHRMEKGVEVDEDAETTLRAIGVPL